MQNVEVPERDEQSLAQSDRRESTQAAQEKLIRLNRPSGLSASALNREINSVAPTHRDNTQ